MNKHALIYRASLAGAAVVAILIGTATALTEAAHADDFTPGVRLVQPYGGCKEAIDYPHSDGADWCRAHGWTVTRRIVIRPDRWVLAHRLPVCIDGETDTPCRWNFGGGQPHGNGEGRAYWVNSAGVLRFVEGMA